MMIAITLGWNVLTGGQEWVRCKARIPRNAEGPARGGIEAFREVITQHIARYRTPHQTKL